MGAMTTPRERDHGLNRASRVTRWFAVAAAAATGLFAFLLARPVASATPRASDSTTSDNGSATGAVGSASSVPGSSGSSGSSSARRTSPTTQLQSPSAAPQRSNRRSRASSGGS